MYHAPVTKREGKTTGVTQYGYDQHQKTLLVEYNWSRLYAYHGVPASTFANLRQAPSLTGYINEHIKPRYGYTEIGWGHVTAREPTVLPKRLATVGAPAFVAT